MKHPYARFLESHIRQDLVEKMVFIGGPRQVGKTTLSRDIIAMHGFTSFRYYNWDSQSDRQQILKDTLSDADLLIFDEIHKYKHWKSCIKGIYDKRGASQKILVTGSAKLDTYRRGGDSFQGRYHYYRLHPFSLSEIEKTHQTVRLAPFEPLSFMETSQGDVLHRLLQFGGFPEPFLKQSDRHLRRWHTEKLERLFYEDVRDLSSVANLQSMRLLGDILPTRVASLLSINSLREDLDVSHKTVSHWLDMFDALYYSYRIYPYQSSMIRALKKEPKLYVWDWSEIQDIGKKFENFIAGHLLKTVHYLHDYEGYNCQLHYLRDREKREVDFLVTMDNKPWFCVEAKVSDAKIPVSLRYFKEKLNIPFTYLVTLDACEAYSQDGIQVFPAATFLRGLV